MEPRHRTTTFLLALFLFISNCLFVNAAKPDVKVSKFHNQPARLFFLDDTSSLIYHDSNAGDVYVSLDEGKTWDPASGIPKGDVVTVIAHPFNNRYAFALGKDTTHYRTDDRGKTWRTFKTQLPVAFSANPLSFHSTESDYIIFHGNKCVQNPFGFGGFCIQETYYTTDAFGSGEPKLLLSDTSRCQFAHSSKDFKHDAPNKLIFCVGFDSTTSDGVRTLASSRLFASDDFFDKDSRILDLGIGKNARGVIALAIVSKYAVVALKDLNANSNGEMLLYISLDAKTWAKGQFPHSSSAKLYEDAYTIVESTTHSLAVDVLLHQRATVGTLFVSNSNGTEYVESLKDTNRNDMGYVDFENIYGIEGVGLANIVKNAREVEGKDIPKQLQSRITFDDGSSWSRLKPPSKDSNGKSISCDTSNKDQCSLHLHSVTTPHNFGRVFSSPAPGFVMGVGSIGEYLLPYEDCDTFLSTDAGVTWQMVKQDAHKYEFGDQGSILVVVNDEDGIDFVSYSLDMGKTWDKVNVDIQFRARALTTVPDSTSQKFVLLAQIARKDQTGDGRFAVIHLDFSPTRKRQCKDEDFEDWYARSQEHECVMGHKQYYRRRKPSEDCYVGDEFKDPVAQNKDCECTDEDYECDYNFVRNGDECVPVGPERISPGVCANPSDKYMGSSGFRLIPGNTCKGGKKKDEKVEKSCTQAAPAEGEVTHRVFPFNAPISQHSYFKNSQTILVRLADDTVWQSSNEGYLWTQIHPGEKFVGFYLHSYTPDRGYLITNSNKVYYTKNTGKTWETFTAPSLPNTFGAQILHFQPRSDYLIWTGDVDCENNGPNCHAEAQYSIDNGGTWTKIETYVRNCAWARDKQLKIDDSEVICESYQDKRRNQRSFPPTNALELVGGTKFYREKKKFFDRVVGFAKFSEFLIVAEFSTELQALDLQVSLDGKNFATGVFPPSLRPQNHAYTILESSTRAVFLHVTTSEFPDPFWGTILKSNGNGTYFGISLENVNRNDKGFVDFEKMINLDGIAVVNIVANPSDARRTGKKQLQTRITHNDGGSWESLTPPKLDSDKRPYSCQETKCALHIHGYTERLDARATYSSPAVPGLMMAVGNVGETLAPYTDSDTFLSRDAGFTWEEVHKDAHLWEFGDSGAVIVIVNDEEPTDHVLFTTNEGIDWKQYTFSQEKIRVRQIVTVPEDTSRKFILFGHSPRSTSEVVAIHLDFSSLTSKQCVLSVDDPGHDDFELWSPSEERQEQCLFGRQTRYHRRVRDSDCVVGLQEKAQDKTVSNCACSAVDFECEFNHIRNDNGECVLADGASPLASDDEVCRAGAEFWYDRTAYRKIPYSSCEGGLTIHQGAQHRCPGIKGHGFFFWFFVLFVPVAIASLIGYWMYRRSGMARGNIRLPDGRGLASSRSRSNFMDTLASVPWFIVGIAGIAWEKLASIRLPFTTTRYRSYGGYRNVPVDEDAQVLRFEDEE